MKTTKQSNIIAWILLIVFTIGTIPKAQLHDWVVHHVDHNHYNPVKQHDKNFNSYKFNCGFVNEIVTNPYSVSLFSVVYKNSVYEVLSTRTLVPYILNELFSLNNLRGPPFNALL